VGDNDTVSVGAPPIRSWDFPARRHYSGFDLVCTHNRIHPADMCKSRWPFCAYNEMLNKYFGTK
jgi:hypothetical protein